ncbi:hypothetical protein DICVIV_11324 [Dictyocaulus viviparus]|uniref:Uncharacterized protein n=1 Tax=Dictyocaulus viviparus TaxID=29172 RepID=A0A0D8XDJ5_DICVI|nr:hypothetical protein DICVIV_11324 [Dictyocaulus viviparus]
MNLTRRRVCTLFKSEQQQLSIAREKSLSVGPHQTSCDAQSRMSELLYRLISQLVPDHVRPPVQLRSTTSNFASNNTTKQHMKDDDWNIIRTSTTRRSQLKFKG